MLAGGFDQRGRFGGSGRLSLACLPFLSHYCSLDTLISLLLIYTFPLIPAHLRTCWKVSVFHSDLLMLQPSEERAFHVAAGVCTSFFMGINIH